MTAHGNADPEDWDDWAGEDEVTGASWFVTSTVILSMQKFDFEIRLVTDND